MAPRIPLGSCMGVLRVAAAIDYSVPEDRSTNRGPDVSSRGVSTCNTCVFKPGFISSSTKCSFVHICKLVSGARGSFLALPAVGHAGTTNVHRSAR